MHKQSVVHGMREVVTGYYESDMGPWTTDAGATLRERRRLDAEDVAVFMNVTPEFASPVGSRTVAEVARSAKGERWLF